MKLNEVINLLSRLPKNPRGVYDELKVRFELLRERSFVSAPSYQPMDFQSVVLGIEQCLQKDLSSFLSESALGEIEEQVRQGIQRISSSQIPFPLGHNGDPKLGRLCYAVCRALQPSVFVETGVAFGVTSSYILKALAVNNKGNLYSVDRPPVEPGAAAHIGALIPKELHGRWHLHRGESRKILPALLAELKNVEIFLHDSRHTYNNMTFEFEAVAPFLTNRSVLVADDVDRNIAFQHWVEQTSPAFWVTTAEEIKESLFGVSVFLKKPRYRSR